MHVTTASSEARETRDHFAGGVDSLHVKSLKLVLLSSLFLGAGLAACDSKEGESKADPKAKANEACGADEKAKAEGSACKACCKDNGVSSYQFDGMNKTCTCG